MFSYLLRVYYSYLLKIYFRLGLGLIILINSLFCSLFGRSFYQLIQSDKFFFKLLGVLFFELSKQNKLFDCSLVLSIRALIPNWCELGLSNKQNLQQSIDTHTLDRPRTSWVETRTLNYLTTKNSSYQEVATIRYGCSNW